MLATEQPVKASWLPMGVIALVQMQMAFNVSALVISMGAIVEAFDTSPTTVGTALVVYSLCVAAFVMLGAKVGTVVGPRLMFQIAIVLHGLSMLMMALSTSATMMIQAQVLAGLAAAAAVPALVVLIAVHYRARQQEQALGLLGAAQAIAGVAAFIIVGFLGTIIGWRWPFGILAILAMINLLLSFKLISIERQKDVKIDWVGAALAASGIALLTIGVNNLNGWGLLLARDDAPLTIIGLSPAPFLIIFGVVFGQAFFAWLRMRRENKKPQLFALEVLDTQQDRAATFCLLIIAALGPAVNFLLPLYIQIVQGRTSLETAVAIIPYTLAIFAAATFVVKLYDQLAPRQIGRFGFITVAAGMFLFAASINNAWGSPFVIFSLIVVGIGEGALLTLLFNVLVSGSHRDLAGHVGALRGTVNNLATALGTAVASLMAVGLLSLLIASSVDNNPRLPPEVISQINFDNVDFLTNEELEEFISSITSVPGEIREAERINEDARLRALKTSFQVLSLIALLAIVPAGRLPGYRSGDVPADTLQKDSSTNQTQEPARADTRAQPRRRTSRARRRTGSAS